MVRVEAVVDVNFTPDGPKPRILYYRDITGELGKGYDPLVLK
ncbi:MAG TPA: hypothetical protein VE988_08765 [Gemmataceae bacterium]|nr:hypothetical protein [Gemmataceae bacterium]